MKERERMAEERRFRNGEHGWNGGSGHVERGNEAHGSLVKRKNCIYRASFFCRWAITKFYLNDFDRKLIR